MSSRTKEAQIGFRLADDVAREFKVLCAMRGIPMQLILEKAVKDFIAQEKKSNPE